MLNKIIEGLVCSVSCSCHFWMNQDEASLIFVARAVCPFFTFTSPTSCCQTARLRISTNANDVEQIITKKRVSVERVSTCPAALRCQHFAFLKKTKTLHSWCFAWVDFYHARSPEEAPSACMTITSTLPFSLFQTNHFLSFLICPPSDLPSASHSSTASFFHQIASNEVSKWFYIKCVLTWMSESAHTLTHSICPEELTQPLRNLGGGLVHEEEEQEK